MAKMILALYDPCRGYIERFLRYASKRAAQKLEICGFTDMDILEESLSGSRIKAVLFSRDENEEGGDERISALLTKYMHEKGLTVMILGEQNHTDPQEEGFAYIYKYQPAEKIIERVLEITGQNADAAQDADHERTLSLSVIYSPWDKTSHPETALKVADIIRRGKNDLNRILYMNLEPFSGMGSYLNLQEDISLSNVIYYYRTRPDQLPDIIRKTAGRFGNMDILTAPGNPEDLEEIEQEEWPDFLESIFRAGDYQNIILDISVMGKKLEELVFKYGNLYIPALPYLTSQNAQGGEPDLKAVKMQEYRDYIRRTRNEKELERIFEIRPDAYR